MLVLLLTISIFYSVFIFTVLFGIWRLSVKQQKTYKTNDLPSVDVVVPYRNESERIGALLESLKKQTCPFEKLRFIFVNDHSVDDSARLVQRFAFTSLYPSLTLDLPDGLEGKKSALELALIHAEADYILFTDADCSVPEDWVQTMLSFAKAEKADMVLAPVEMYGKGFVANFQTAEFLTIQTITIATAGLGNAVLSNGANLLVKTEILKAMNNPFKRELSSGDDVFLMEQMKKDKKRIAFCLNPKVLVKTPACDTWRKLFVQRARWLSKTQKYPMSFSLMLSVIFGFMQFVYLLFVVLLMIKGEFLVLLFFLLHKLIFDFVVMHQTAIKTGAKLLVFHATVLSIVYPFWTIISGVSSFIIKPQWKGRKIKV